MKKLVLVALFFGLITAYGFAIGQPLAEAWTVNLGWDANTETDLAGYRLYHTNTQGVYDMSTPEDTLGATDVTTSTDVGDGFHCWVLTAFDLSDNESVPSNEICMTLPDDAPTYDNTPPLMPGSFMPLEVLP